MTRIDRYILSEFARVFLICFLTFLGLFIVTDFVNNLDELIDHGKTNGGLPRTLFDFYGPKVPWFFDLISRIVALVAAVFAVTSLQRNNEMASMMAAGISRWRIVKPLILGVLAIAIFGALNRELLIPKLGAKTTRDARNIAGKSEEEFRSQYDHASGIFIDAKGIVPATRTITDLSLSLPTSIAQRGTKLRAPSARHIQAQGEIPNGLLMVGVAMDKVGFGQSIKHKDQRVAVYHPNDTPWLKADQLFVPTDLPFQQLQDGTSWRQHASIFSLVSNARNESLDSGADVSVAIHRRVLQPVMDMIVLFLGIPVVLSRESRNAFVAVGSCMLVVALFVIATLASHGAGMNYLISPSLAVWLPVMIFVPVAVLMSEPLRR